jgi:hypothetical protein
MTGDSHFNKEGFLDSPTEDDVVRVQCLDFDIYCGICNEIYKESARDAVYEMEQEKAASNAEAESEAEEDKARRDAEGDAERQAEWEAGFQVEEGEES